MADVIVYHTSGQRSRTVCNAMVAGIRRMGHSARRRDEKKYSRPTTDIAVFYGLQGNLRRVWRDHQAEGLTGVYIDLGYWGRRDPGRWTGFHKFVINGRHPTAYFQDRAHTDERFRYFRLSVKQYRKSGGAILLAGMSGKAASQEGFAYLEWERGAIAKIREVTDRPIIYRPKPGKSHGTDKLLGTIHSPRSESLEQVLRRCHATVSHHSNVAVDGLIEGIPAFCIEGVATPMAQTNLAKIEKPRYPDGREQWLADIAWCQFTVREMERGLPWRHLLNEGLIK